MIYTLEFKLECVDKYKKGIHVDLPEGLRSLPSFPERHPEIQDLRIAGARIRKMSIYNGRYVVLYKVAGDTVVIYDVVDSQRTTRF